jgi:phosphoesterase RecJ-like protein
MNKIAIYNKILVKIKQYDTIIIHRHIRPDGDCIGSQMGLKEILKASFPRKKDFCGWRRNSELPCAFGSKR